MTTAGSSHLDETRQDIEQTRAQLGETVAAMAAKTDVKARLRSKATAAKTDVKARLRSKATAAAGRLRQRVTYASQSAKQRATHASQSAKTRATQLIRTASQTASQRTKPVTQKAQQATTAVGDAAKAGARTTSKVESTLVTTTRRATTKVGRSVRANPIPALAATGTAATLAFAVYRRRRPRARNETIMNGKLMFGAGLGLGYVLGTRAGRERFDQISGKAKQVLGSKPVQDAADAVQEQAGHLYDGGKQMMSEQSHKM